MRASMERLGFTNVLASMEAEKEELDLKFQADQSPEHSRQILASKLTTFIPKANLTTGGPGHDKLAPENLNCPTPFLGFNVSGVPRPV